MGWANDQIALLIVTAGSTFSGIFVYSPSPGTGNLVDSITAATLTDPYGNLAIGGIVNYQPGASPIAIQTSGAFIRFSQAASEAGPYTPFATFGPLGADFQITTTGNIQLFSGAASSIIANNPLEVLAATDLDGALDVSGLATFNGQVNVLTLPVNIESMAQPATPGSGVKLWSGTLGNLETVAGDGNVYGTQRLLLEATGQTVNSASFVSVTGWGGIALQVATYHMRGRLFCNPIQAGGAIELKFTGSGGLAIPSMDVTVNERTWVPAGGAITWGNGIDMALGSTFTSTVVGAGLGLRIIEFSGKLAVTVAGTLTPQVATTVAADTYGIQTGDSYIEFLPIGA